MNEFGSWQAVAGAPRTLHFYLPATIEQVPALTLCGVTQPSPNWPEDKADEHCSTCRDAVGAARALMLQWARDAALERVK